MYENVYDEDYKSYGGKCKTSSKRGSLIVNADVRGGLTRRSELSSREGQVGIHKHEVSSTNFICIRRVQLLPDVEGG